MIALVLLAACIDPTAYGAVPNDDKSDAEAIQRAVDEAEKSQGEVCLPAGVWDLDKMRTIGSITVKSAVVIRGVGPASRLRMTGDGHKGDWRALEILGASHVVIQDLAIDGLGAVDTEEQTHLLEVGPGSTQVTIRDVELGPMRRSDQRVGEGIGGDCIRLLGTKDHEVRGVTIIDSKLIDCDRSGIMFQRAVHDVVVARVTISGDGDTPIDFEPSPPGLIENVLFTQLTITRPPDAQGSEAISIVGAEHVTLARSTIDGGGVMIADAKQVELVDDTIGTGPGIGPTISMFRHVDDVHLARDTITRPASAKAAALIRATHNNGAIPHGIVIEDCKLRQETVSPVVALESVSAVTVKNNTIDYTASEGRAVVDAKSIAADITDLVVTGNIVHGTPSQVVRLAPRANHVSAEVHDNTVDAKHVDGVTCDGEAARCVQVAKINK